MFLHALPSADLCQAANGSSAVFMSSRKILHGANNGSQHPAAGPFACIAAQLCNGLPLGVLELTGSLGDRERSGQGCSRVSMLGRHKVFLGVLPLHDCGGLPVVMIGNIIGLPCPTDKACVKSVILFSLLWGIGRDRSASYVADSCHLSGSSAAQGDAWCSRRLYF